ncbi:hypothetical protein [Pseudomonas sp. NPDC089406]|uniref:hypothetical protein n=1 Tax=Pseudomonas sp. NPDC089406 TaxID=3364463 RepID=UPI00384E0BDB
MYEKRLRDDHAALKIQLVRQPGGNAQLQPVKSSATPAVDRLFSPCLIAARRLFVQKLVKTIN